MINPVIKKLIDKRKSEKHSNVDVLNSILDMISESDRSSAKKRINFLNNPDYAMYELLLELKDVMSKIVTERKFVKGEKGKDGKDGLTPIKGVHYHDGKHGRSVEEDKIIDKVLGKIQLPEVKHGKDGSPDTPQDILNKLKSLNKEELIELFPEAKNSKHFDLDDIPLEKVKGLDKWLLMQVSELKRNFGGHGVPSLTAGAGVILTKKSDGGYTVSSASSTFYTETPTGTIDGVNDTYTTVHDINTVLSFAINGQFLHPTTDYTVSGNTITMVTPLDASLSGKPFTIIYN